MTDYLFYKKMGDTKYFSQYLKQLDKNGEHFNNYIMSALGSTFDHEDSLKLVEQYIKDNNLSVQFIGSYPDRKIYDAKYLQKYLEYVKRNWMNGYKNDAKSLLETLLGAAISYDSINIITDINLFIRENGIRLDGEKIISSIYCADCRKWRGEAQARNSGLVCIEYYAYDELDNIETYRRKYRWLLDGSDYVNSIKNAVAEAYS